MKPGQYFLGVHLVRGFMLIEVLIALALFGLSAVFLVDGAFVASRVARDMKDTRELEQDLIWVRSEVLKGVIMKRFPRGVRLTLFPWEGLPGKLMSK